jgi:phospholipase/carboxylesterase
MLAGFSQGAVIALETACRHPDPVGGAIALSGYLADPDTLPEAVSALPVFLAHGRDDGVVPLRLGQAARQRLDDLGYAVDWHVYDLPHSVSLEEIRDIRTWILRRWQSN